jgi:hypothetical protein
VDLQSRLLGERSADRKIVAPFKEQVDLAMPAMHLHFQKQKTCFRGGECTGKSTVHAEEERNAKHTLLT